MSASPPHPTRGAEPETLASFAENNPDPVLRFDGAANLTYSNPAGQELARQLGRDTIAEILPAELPEVLQRCLGQDRAPVRLETTLEGRTLSWRFFRGLPGLTVHCQVRDVTERQELEAQLRHAQKLDSIGRLAAGIAHDFNNLLTVIQGHAGLLRVDPALAPSLNESVQQIGLAAERGSQLTRQLRAFSRRNLLQPQFIDLNQFLTQLSELLRRTIGEDISCQFSYASDLPRLHADPGLLEQVIVNLAVNAREAMPNGGQLVVGTSAVEIDRAYVQRHPTEARPGRYLCLTVSDTGCGMDTATLGRLFEPFFSTKPTAPGRGIGLATVYGIVKQHQGWIEVRSQLGQGSTFRVFLPPQALGTVEFPAALPQEGVLRGTETVLVVEDEAPVRWILKDVLRRYGYHVIEAGSGVEALAQWHQHHAAIALLLTDVIMPVGLNGQELAERFASQKPGLKVMYISGYSLQVVGKGLALLNGLNFLQKPFDGARLALAVRNCLDT